MDRQNRLDSMRKKKKLAQKYSLGNVCFYCGSEASTLDHKHPTIRGGTDEQDNLCTACQWCNKAKSGAYFEEFLIFIEFMKQILPNFPQDKPEKYGRYIKKFRRFTGIDLHRMSTPEGRLGIARK